MFGWILEASDGEPKWIRTAHDISAIFTQLVKRTSRISMALTSKFDENDVNWIPTGVKTMSIALCTQYCYGENKLRSSSKFGSCHPSLVQYIWRTHDVLIKWQGSWYLRLHYSWPNQGWMRIVKKAEEETFWRETKERKEFQSNAQPTPVCNLPSNPKVGCYGCWKWFTFINNLGTTLEIALYVIDIGMRFIVIWDYKAAFSSNYLSVLLTLFFCLLFAVCCSILCSDAFDESKI